MTNNIVQHVENYDDKVLTYVYEHPTENNVQRGIELITNYGVDTLTGLSR